jgi:chemotaxis protein methyltransferase CheR/type IV pilus assembly protein PilK
MQELGFSDYREYYRYVLSQEQLGAECVTLVDRLTIHETRFFRHPPSFALVRECLLPKGTPAGEGPIQFAAWSIGCATGEEPYSLAMVLNEHFASMACSYDFRILASDISLPTLLVAEQGVYPLHRVKEVPLSLRLKYMRPIREGRLQVIQALRERVHFVQANALHEGHAAWASIDLILCQNVLMYFTPEQRIGLLNRLVGYLAPGGGLVLGPGEVLRWSHPKMERVRFPNTLAFRRSAMVNR